MNIELLIFCNKFAGKHNFFSGYKLLHFAGVLGENILKSNDKDNDGIKDSEWKYKEIINQTVRELTSIKLSDILSCSDFMDILNEGDDGGKKQYLDELLSKYNKNMKYNDVKKKVTSNLLNPKAQKIFFAEVLPKYNFEVCNKFDSTWDMFKNDYIDFKTLVTKFWARENFDQGQNNKDQKNTFQNFASEYNKCLNHELSEMSKLKEASTSMVRALYNKSIIDMYDSAHILEVLNSATDVGILGIIAQFFSDLFSIGKTAFQSVSKTRQDGIISNLKPWPETLKQGR